ncbi:hypothetical protein [Myxococcus sp. Y35]|uniref:hypothetical protein n=1 Tax=Pseudomyxococcus flavus TaxID=3115648 RepID=UPI003CED7D2B
MWTPSPRRVRPAPWRLRGGIRAPARPLGPGLSAADVHAPARAYRGRPHGASSVACGLALTTLGGAGIQVLGPSCLERLRRRKRGHHRWWHRSQEPLMESMETALAMALLGVSVLPLAGEDTPMAHSAFIEDAETPHGRHAVSDDEDAPPADRDDGVDDLDFEAAFASY